MHSYSSFRGLLVLSKVPEICQPTRLNDIGIDLHRLCSSTWHLCTATGRVYTLLLGGESRGKWLIATVNDVGLVPTTAPVLRPQAELVRRHMRPGTPGCV